jgi:hypothetical protein
MPGGGSKLANKVKKRIHVAPSAVHVIMEAWRMDERGRRGRRRRRRYVLLEAWRMDGGVADVSVRA